MEKTAIIVLAAGGSSRLGRPKQLLPYKGTTLLNHCINELIGIPNTDVWVVIGAYSEEVKKVLDGETVHAVYNNNWEKGMGSSIAVTLQALKAYDAYKRVLITLGDLPLLTRDHFRQLLKEHKGEDHITLTQYTDIQGVPVIFGKRYYQELENCSGDEGAKAIIKNHQKNITPVPTKIPFTDIDTEAAYQELLRSTGGTK
ncbi:MAG: nucleotidyltransferase family protein [Bacteroidota bacterium]